jgi:carboxypeptidase C (cathepsin A)
MFYALFESRPDKDGARDTEYDPLLIWLRGSPGCSASAQMFSETGPYNVKMDELFGEPRLELNAHSWNNFTNIMYLDAPVGTGYSFKRGQDKRKRDYNIDQIVHDFVNFMKMFYDKHESFRGRELYLVAQDFTAGSYLPAFAAAIQDVRDSKAELKDEAFEEMFLADSEKEWDAWFGLSGIFMISPEVDESIQRHDTRNYAEKVELITSVEVPLMSVTSDWCRQAIESG